MVALKSDPAMDVVGAAEPSMLPVEPVDPAMGAAELSVLPVELVVANPSANVVSNGPSDVNERVSK